MDKPTNHEGLSFDEWCDAAGPGCPRDAAEARRAWRLCDDPTDYRAEAEKAATEGAEKSEDGLGSWLVIIALTVLGAGLVFVAFSSTP